MSPEGTRLGGDRIHGIIAGEINITAPNALAADTEANVDVATAGTELDGIAVGDHVYLSAPDTLEAQLVVKSVIVQAANTLRVRYRNTGAVAAPATSPREYAFLWFDKNP